VILDSISRLQHYRNRHPALALAGEFLARKDLHILGEGRHEIEGGALFALVSRCGGRGREKARMEAHRKHIDVQYCLSGEDEIGVRPLAECRTITTAYDEEKDIIFFGETAREWVRIGHDRCAVFFPGDAHAPLAGSGPCWKIVLKIKILE
jgi:biofilm protein TabA